jgi:hypothetical protein
VIELIAASDPEFNAARRAGHPRGTDHSNGKPPPRSAEAQRTEQAILCAQLAAKIATATRTKSAFGASTIWHATFACLRTVIAAGCVDRGAPSG